MNEKRFLLVVMAVAITIAAIPFLYGVIATPSGFTYSGRHAQNTGDYGVYFSQMEQAREGNLLFYNSFTSVPHDRVIFNPFWLTAGWVAAAIGSIPIAFHLVRLIHIPLLVLVLWYAISFFVSDPRIRKAALIGSLFLGGVFGYAITTDGSIFLQTLFSPHLVSSAILLILSIVWMAKSIEEKKLPLAFYASCTAFVLFWFHPYHIATFAWITLGLCVVAWLRKRIYFSDVVKRLGIVALAAIGPTLYYWWMFRSVSFGSNWLSQSDTLMRVRGIWELPWAFLPFFLLAIFGLYRFYKLKRPHADTIAVWFVVPLIAMCIPVFFRMRMSGLWFVPLIILSLEGVLFFLEHFSRQKIQKIIYIGLAIVACWSILINGKIFFQSIALYDQKVSLAVVPRSIMDAFRWIRNNTEGSDATLASWYVSGIMPGFTGRSVVGGHGIQTPYEEQIQQAIHDFYSGQTLDYQNFFKSHNVSYVFFSSYERALGSATPWISFVTPIFQEGDVTVYRVK